MSKLIITGLKSNTPKKIGSKEDYPWLMTGGNHTVFSSGYTNGMYGCGDTTLNQIPTLDENETVFIGEDVKPNKHRTVQIPNHMFNDPVIFVPTQFVSGRSSFISNDSIYDMRLGVEINGTIHSSYRDKEKIPNEIIKSPQIDLSLYIGTYIDIPLRTFIGEDLVPIRIPDSCNVIVNGSNATPGITFKSHDLGNNWTIHTKVKPSDNRNSGTIIEVGKGPGSIKLGHDKNGYIYFENPIGSPEITTSYKLDGDDHSPITIRKKDDVIDVVIDMVPVLETNLYSISRGVVDINIGKTRHGLDVFSGLITLPTLWNKYLDREALKTVVERKIFIAPFPKEMTSQLIMDSDTMIADSITNNTISHLDNLVWECVDYNNFVNQSIKYLLNLKLPVDQDFQALINLIYVRDKVALFRKENGLVNDVYWTDQHLLSGKTPIKAIHINEIYDAIKEVYVHKDEYIETVYIQRFFSQPVLANNINYPVSSLLDRLDIALLSMQQK